MAKKTAAKKTVDPLDRLANDPLRVIALMLWKDRMRNPDLYVQITAKDIQGLDDCTGYLKLIPEVKIEHPAGLPAQAAIPAAGNRRAVPARDATPSKPFVVVSLLGKDERGITGPLKPVENNEDDYDTAKDASAVRKAKDQAPMLAERLVQQARAGEFSLSDMQDAADALLILALAV